MRTLVLLGALGCGLIAGVLFAFSAFVMPGLGMLAPAAAVRAMQAINIAAVTPAFMGVLFGTALICLIVLGFSLRGPYDTPALLRLIGAFAYLATIGITIAYHVPRNDALAALDPSSTDATAYWTLYLRQWTVANHLRAATAFAGALLLTISYRIGKK